MVNQNASLRRRYEKVIRAYEFLRTCADEARPFNIDEFIDATAWKRSTFETYLTKQWRQLIVEVDGTYRVRPDFLNVTEAQFLDLSTQRRVVFSDYKRTMYKHVVVYEFLLPLTRETQLREALDALFYEDAIMRRLRVVETCVLESIVRRNDDESDDMYIARVCRLVGERFGGYSISHVSGRFRAEALDSRQAVGVMLSQGARYLIDETTAVVRFIIKCNSSKVVYTDVSQVYSHSHSISGSNHELSQELRDELREIRALFFHIFVEAVVRTIRGEEEIWLLESGPEHHLFVWEAQRD